ncbi:MAG: DUF5107 domain-containing protein [Phycisphaeraceae bacterium]|nr:DUF5107 domain-containing protein [Phycisphaeraceae bacterium]
MMIARLSTLMLLALLPFATACQAGDGLAGAVAHREGTMTLPWYTSEPRHVTQPRANAALWARPGTQKRDGERTFHTITLENQYLKVVIIPEIGGPIARTIYKPTGEDVFFFEEKAKDWLPFWESGVKVNFPFREHCIGMDQPASWRIIEHEHGAVSLAMWMEFSRHNQPYQGTMFGRFSNMMLSQIVTLEPDRNAVSITYRIINPAPYRQGRRVWTDALFPRNHTPEGIVQGDGTPPKPRTDTQWIFPARWAANHLGREYREYDQDERFIGRVTREHTSVFSLDIPHGFAGLWYPSVRVNRLRIFDPTIAPGVKYYFQGEGRFRPDTLTSHMYNFAELWGGSDNIMEGVEHWLLPGHDYRFSHTYTMIRDIGRVSYANEHAAVHVEPGRRVEAITLAPIEQLSIRWNGTPLGKPMACGPERPVRLDLPEGIDEGTLELFAGEQLLLKQSFPLSLESDTSRHEFILAAAAPGQHEHTERLNDQMDHGRTLSGTLRSAPADSLQRGRIAYRLGRMEPAVETLTRFTEKHPDVGEGWHLLGMAMLEDGKVEAAGEALDRALAAESPWPGAAYHRAILDLAGGRADAALNRLSRLIEAQPGHYEARLLHTKLLARQGDRRDDALGQARKLEERDPADPRAAYVLMRITETLDDEAAHRRALDGFNRLMKEPGAQRRLNEFQQAGKGRFIHPARLQSF